MRLFGGLFAGSSPDDPVTAYKKPAGRKELFRQAFRDNFRGLMLVNLLYLVFCIPLILWVLPSLLGIEDLLRHFSQEELAQLIGRIFGTVLGMIPGLVICAVGSTGIAYVTRNWARGQHAFYWQDFFDSIRKNWKQAIVPGVISSAFLLVAYWYAAFLLSNPDRAGVSLAPGVITGIVILLWEMMLPTVMMEIVTYDLPLRAILKNAAIMTIAHFLTAVRILLARLAPVIVSLILILFVSPKAGSLLLIVYTVLFGFAWPWLLGSSFANRLCEEFLNPRIGAPVDIGLVSERIDNHSTEEEK